ncbi:cilia-and flagella-associated protein 57 [Trichonephila clavipes]|nr:cilia-and flagella-associated protein 57 [Trichonephila clavipes]
MLNVNGAVECNEHASRWLFQECNPSTGVLHITRQVATTAFATLQSYVIWSRVCTSQSIQQVCRSGNESLCIPEVQNLLWRHDNSLLSSDDEGTICEWDIPRKKASWKLSLPKVNHVALASPSKDLSDDLYVASSDNKIRLIKDGTVVRNIIMLTFFTFDILRIYYW